MRRFDAEEAGDPLELFRCWLAEAGATEPNDPEAAALGTATRDGAPSVRMVLVKGVDERGFRFFTNEGSQKGRELAENPRAALCFHWKTQRRQVRVEGAVRGLREEDADAYFHSRSLRSRVGAAVSRQSRPLGSREELENAARQLEAEAGGVIPRPNYWRGYCVEPKRIEFWQQGEDRLHDRIVFHREADGWNKQRLYP